MAKIKGRVVIDNERCKGCNLCAVSCPTNVLTMSKSVNTRGYNFSYTQNEEACIGCASCALVCPDACITVYKVKVE